MARFTTDVQMRFRDLDPLGHVNNVVFLTYCELARTRFYLANDFKRSLHDIDFILARAEIDYLSPAEWGDEIRVAVWPSRIGASSFTLSYEITERRSGRLLAKSVSVLVSYDYGKRESKPIPADFRAVLEANLEPA
ncbi:MAG: hypothetical protein A3K68_02720 [Euryarchaeota archaeon RBG_16_68_13]|nr:MAG: hypothetical protein A3K68_02720 [Euryarchaeota archaeon RBG_16_68_13]